MERYEEDQGSIVVHPTPRTATENDRVDVAVDGHSVFVEDIEATEADLHYNFPGAAEITYSVAQFDFDGQVTVEVTVDDDIEKYRLSPERYDLDPTVDGESLLFSLDCPRNLFVRIGSEWLFLFADPIETDRPDPDDDGVTNILEYDVDKTGVSLSTEAFQEAIIDVATGPEAGGIIYVPPGIYRTGTLELYSDVTLYLAGGALIQASEDRADFGYQYHEEHQRLHQYALIKIHHASNVAIEGRGTIDGAGTLNGPLRLVHTMDADDVRFRDVMVRNGHSWMFPILDSEDIAVENVKLFGPITANTDGFNPDASTDVTIDDAFVCTGDDPLVLKANNQENRLNDVEDVTIENCVVLTVKSALKIGTETRADRFSGIRFRGNDILCSDRAFTIYLRDGAIIKDVVFADNAVEFPGGPREPPEDDNHMLIDVEIRKRTRPVTWHPSDWEDRREDPGRIRDVTFENTTVDTSLSQILNPSRITGYDRDNDVSGLTFRNLQVNDKVIRNPETEIEFGGGDRVHVMDIDDETTSNITFEE